MAGFFERGPKLGTREIMYRNLHGVEGHCILACMGWRFLWSEHYTLMSIRGVCEGGSSLNMNVLYERYVPNQSKIR